MVNEVKDNLIRFIQLTWVCHLRDRYNIHLSKLEQNRRNLIKKKANVESIIFNLCIHNWERDLEAKNERTHYICTKCNAWK